jgi:hypothetical protein
VVEKKDDDVDSGWPDEPLVNQRDTVAPPKPTEAEPPTKPKRSAPAMFRLDSTSAFERPDPSAVVSRRGRASLLGLADDAIDRAPEPSEALDLVEREVDRATPIAPAPPASASRLSSRSPERDPLREMKERFSLGDYSGALVVAEALLDDDPEHAEALKCAAACQKVLEQMYTTRIGPLDRVPFVAVPTEQLRWLNLDHRAGFVLSHIDGQCSLEQILDVSGMPTLDALRILFELVQQRVVAFR